ncbi:hypothetical protein ZWY2020_002443 [Hordeum vulgare]|nr:hypothetical protein ZWY2020_002443 [Hordeum vulgare]
MSCRFMQEHRPAFRPAVPPDVGFMPLADRICDHLGISFPCINLDGLVPPAPARPHPPSPREVAATTVAHQADGGGARTGIVASSDVDTDTQHQPAADSHQASNTGPEWIDLFVRDMSNASDMDDARARASRAREALMKSILEGA